MLQGEQLRDDHLERDVPIQAQIRGPIDERRPPRSMSDSRTPDMGVLEGRDFL
jgi:hypothetical protein